MLTKASTPKTPAGRYAPSPTGALHLGNLRTAVAAHASARAQGLAFLLRIEDLDPPRCRAEFEMQQLADLGALGIEWDATPLRQSERSGIYHAHLAALITSDLAYPCFCSRKEVAQATSAPHADGPEPPYPGTCAALSRAETQRRITNGQQHSFRLRVHGAPATFADAFMGHCAINLTRDGGDFVLRRADGLFAYQLACAVDDALSGVVEVVRGADLLTSGLRQSWLLQSLGLPLPRYAHLPLVYGHGGIRLSKRTGAEDLRGLAARGMGVAQVLGWIAHSFGIAEAHESLTMNEVLQRWPQVTPKQLRQPLRSP